MSNPEFNRFGFDMREQYQDRINCLQQKIKEQQYEILRLQEQIKYLTYPKEYDC